ncbi:hypothetical protein METH_16565 [Leisingera methylohalidivorans DSM 14336]|uniref:Uncharacterized protein n=1 Tax=Leisingera methylohalidivorans DSM 14336 TaxID=999552 RepID=V9VZI1_9RHOB|nr:hypothetical protein METH_16565 [Leisingera methylohalidivorans DSM 14336]
MPPVLDRLQGTGCAARAGLPEQIRQTPAPFSWGGSGRAVKISEML